MAEIQLTKGKVALVDESDLTWLSLWKWMADSRGYAVRRGQVSDGVLRGKSILMHRQIKDVLDQSFVMVDHKNHNRLDNRRDNLRNCICSQNAANSLLSKDSVSGYKGVCFRKGYKKNQWKAEIRVSGKKIYLGVFDSKTQAAMAYNEAAKRYFGDFACLNEVK